MFVCVGVNLEQEKLKTRHSKFKKKKHNFLKQQQFLSTATTITTRIDQKYHH
jgi:hypothetical protein